MSAAAGANVTTIEGLDGAADACGRGELDARWDQVQVWGAPEDAKRYNNLFWGPPRGPGAAQRQDFHLPAMLAAVVAHPPRFGSKLKSFDPAPALAVKGVEQVVAIPDGVALLAHDFWTAKLGRGALVSTIVWDEPDALKLGSEEIPDQYRELAAKPGTVARKEGDSDGALASAFKVIEVEFTFPTVGQWPGGIESSVSCSQLAMAALRRPEVATAVVRPHSGRCGRWQPSPGGHVTLLIVRHRPASGV